MGPGSPYGNKGGCPPDVNKGMGYDKGGDMMKGKGFMGQGMPGGKPCGGKPGGAPMPGMPGPMGGADPMKGMPPSKGMPGGVQPGKGMMVDGKGMEGKMG